MKAIAFSVYGTDPLYSVGAIRNAELVPVVYPGWEAHFWLGAEITEDTRKALKSAGAKLHRPPHKRNGMFWRFEAMKLDVERFLVRDVDSRVSEREAECVRAWEAEGQNFLIIRDHPNHSWPMMGGTWGAHPVDWLREELGKVEPSAGFYLEEQIWLSTTIWSRARKSALQFDFCNRHLYPDARPFPATGYRFVGERIGADEEPEWCGWQQRINYLEWK